MNYTEAREYMIEISGIGSKLGLEAITELLKRLGNPQNELKFIHVAGTNGKGSTCSYTANILAQAGYKVGRYMSPVVQEYEECIQVNRPTGEWQYIAREQIASHITRIKEICEQMVADGLSQPTVYEMEMAMSMLEFKRQQCDLVVLETLMGGRLDATNVVTTTLVAAFTSISMDHMQFLGDTLIDIATEKAGIIKPGIEVVVEQQSNEAFEVITTIANEKGASVEVMDLSRIQAVSGTEDTNSFCYKGEGPFSLQMLGDHQRRNACIAIEICNALRKLGYQIPQVAIAKGLTITKLFGRFTILKEKPVLIVDGAHNYDAANVLRKTLISKFPNSKGVFIMGVFKDKDYEGILSQMGSLAKCLITITAPGPRGLQSDALAHVAEKYCNKVVDGSNLQNALELATRMVEPDEYILCFGSLSYLGQIPACADAMNCFQ